ncbi:MAG: sn-glycerol-1-phosphate dehydrogenase [Clostridia bacterium]|nr:sn-glycerol-1-phosphate dehydrogenase [Clostridia bacterium]
MTIDSLQYNGICRCGKEHRMETEFAMIESGCLKNLSGYLSKYGIQGYTVAVYDENTYAATADRHPSVDLDIILDPTDLHANEHGVSLLMEKLPSCAEVLIAIGSGTIHDITRYCAYIKKAEFVSCPTAASVDGFCSSVAAMTWNGCKKTLTAVAPKIVIADTDVFMNAPIRLTRSGFGDMIGKYIALTDWKIANILTNEFYCDRIAQITFEATQSVLESVDGIIEGKPQAYERLMYGLLLSGLAMQMIGNSRPASGAEHHISHLIEMAPVGLDISSNALHGEKVGVGTLLAIEEYKRLATASKISFLDYTEFNRQTIVNVFGETMTEEILKENEHDAAISVTSSALRAHWNELCEEIEKLPEIEFLRNVYLKFGVKSQLSDIGLDDVISTKLLDYSPMVRNRLTLMRLRGAIKIGEHN